LALDGPGSEDFIRWFNVRRRGQIEFLGDTPAGAFLTDLEANEDGLFAVTANRNNPADPTAPRDEVRVYRIERTGLVLDAAVQTGVFPPNYKKIATARGRGGKRHVLFTEFQSDWLRSLIYSPDEP
jgi:hypothetical protein